jgi:hypothetical protein
MFAKTWRRPFFLFIEPYYYISLTLCKILIAQYCHADLLSENTVNNS